MPHYRQQVFLFLGQRMHLVGIAAIRRLGGPDQGCAGPRHDEHRASIARAFDVVNACRHRMGNHDVRPLNQIHVRNRDRRLDGARHLGRPRARGIDEHPGLDLDVRAGHGVTHRHALVAQNGARESRRHRKFRTQSQRGFHHRPGQQGIVGLRIVIANHGIEILGLQAVELRPLSLGHAAEAHGRIEAAEQRIQPQADFQLPWPSAGVAVHRNEKWLQFDELGGDAQMNGTFVQALAYQCELTRFQVAQAAVNQLAGPARCAAGQGLPLDEQGLMAGSGRSLKYAGAVNAAADDDHIVFFH